MRQKDWIELWCASPSFMLTCQTNSALVTKLRPQADLTDELIDDGYEFVKTTRFQNDSIERRFSQYWQMSGEGSFKFRDNLRLLIAD